MADGNENPYASPQTEISAVKPLAQRVLTENTLFYLKGAAPWLRFIGVAGFIFLGLGAVNFITVLVAFQNMSVPGFESLGVPFLLGIFLVVEIIGLFPAVFIFQFGGKLRAYLHSGDEADLEQAFKNNKSLWTFTGVLTIIFLGLVGLSLLITLPAAAMSAVFG